MSENSSIRINASGTYSNYFQITETGARIWQGTTNPNNVSLTPSPATGDLYICTSIPEMFINNGSIWVPIGESAGAAFYTQNITTSGVIIGQGVTFQGTLFASVNISTAASLILPVPVTTGTTIILKDESGAAGTNTISVTTQDDSTIDGQQTVYVDMNYGCYTFLYTGSNWTIVSAIASFPLNEMNLGGGVAYGYTLPAQSDYRSFINNWEYNFYDPNTYYNGYVLTAINVVSELKFPMNFAGSFAACGFASSIDSVINITINNIYVGTLTFYANTFVGFFTTADVVSANPGDVIVFSVATTDDNLGEVSFTLEGGAQFIPIAFTNDLTITNFLSDTFVGADVAVQGTSFPANANIRLGYSTSQTIPPSEWTTTTANSGRWTTAITIPVSGTFYVWAQIVGTDVVTTQSVNILAPSVSFSSASNGTYYAAYATDILGYVSPAAGDVEIQMGYSTSSSIAPTSWNTIETNGQGEFDSTFTFPSIGTYWITAQEISSTLSTTLEVYAGGPTLLIIPSNNYYTGTLSISGMVGPPEVQTILVGINTTNTMPGEYDTVTSDENGIWTDSIEVDTVGTYWIIAQEQDTDLSASLEISVGSFSAPSISIVQSVISTSGGDASIPLPQTPVPGNWLIALAATRVNDAPGPNWTAINDSYDNSNFFYVGAFSYQVQEGDTTGPYQPIQSGSSGCVVALYELSGIGQTLSVDQVDGIVDFTSNGGTNTMSSGVNATVPTSLELSLAVGQQGTTSSMPIPQFDNSWSIDDNISGVVSGPDGFVTGECAHRMLSSGQSLGANITYTSTTANGLCWIALNIPSV